MLESRSLISPELPNTGTGAPSLSGILATNPVACLRVAKDGAGCDSPKQL